MSVNNFHQPNTQRRGSGDGGLTEAQGNSLYDRNYGDVEGLITAKKVKAGDIVMTGLTRWQIVTNATYTLPYFTRVKVFNTLPLDSGLYAYPLSDLYVEDFCSDAVTADNAVGITRLVSVVRDGICINPNGKMFRIFDGVTGIVASSANPTTDDAGTPSEMLYFDDFEDLRFAAGGYYVADQSTSGTKYYFPSTLSLTNCKRITFDVGATFESKGENWGAADFSGSETFDRRLVFSATNGGHAIYCGRCDGVYGSPTARKAGSVASIYFSSSRGVALDSPFSNAGSLGYAAYTFDAWVGNLAHTGFTDYHGTMNNPRSHKELMLRREDGLQAGSDVYAGKGGVLTEDVGVQITCTGGYIADMYANGSNKRLGYAFGAGSGSVCISTGAIVRECQEVAFTNSATTDDSVCTVKDVDAIVGLTGCLFDNQSFGTGKITLTGKVRVNDTRVWAGEVETLANTSLVASMKPTSPAFAVINCDARGDEHPPAGSEGRIFSLISNKNEATYGGVIIEGGDYETKGYLIRSEGWGGASANNDGLIIQGGARIIDRSTTALDGYLNYTNKSGSNIFTYVYHDLRDCFIQTNNWRSLDWALQGTGLDTLIRIPERRRNCYSLSQNYDNGGTRVEVVSIDGLSGPDTLITFKLEEDITFRSKYITSDVAIVKNLGRVGSYDTSGNELKVQYKLEGDVRSDYAVGTTYGLVGKF